MRRVHASICLIALSGIASVGCSSSSPTTAPTVAAPDTMPAMPAVTMVTPPGTKDLTHVLTKDEPDFASEPSSASAPSSGTLKSGSKVLVVIPGAEFSQVVTETGISAYTVTDGLKPLGK